MKRSVLVFGFAGLIGPLIVLLIGVENSIVYDIAASLWITWPLAAWESTTSPAIGATIAVVTNMVVYAALGAVVAVSGSPIWKATIGVLMVAGVWFFNQMQDGSVLDFLVTSVVLAAALVLTVVPKLD